MPCHNTAIRTCMRKLHVVTRSRSSSDLVLRFISALLCEATGRWSGAVRTTQQAHFMPRFFSQFGTR